MKILFIASIQGKTGRESDYVSIVEALKAGGNIVYADHVLNHTQEELDSWSNDKKVDFHKSIFDLIRKCDVIVGEVSYPSVSVGYLISMALDFSKPTILMYKGNNEPNLLSTLADSDKLQVVKYDDRTDLQEELSSCLEYAMSVQDVRFNFFISPEIGRYLDWVSKNKRIPRAVYLRKLIENDMKENKEYTG